MNRQEILNWLREDDALRLEELWRQADAVRRSNVGDEVHLRGLVEISNHCVRQCHYCGIRAGNAHLARYRMSAEEILACARQAVEFGYGTVVLQSGEDYGIAGPHLGEIVRQIKAETPLAVTLSLGERDDADLAAWRSAGADRYLLRFETSNRQLYERIHPDRAGRRSDRPAMLRRLREMGYEIGSGVMIGLPGQTSDDLANDLELFAELDLDMIGVGPYIPHSDTPLGKMGQEPFRSPHVAWSPSQATTETSNEKVPDPFFLELMTYKMIALTRLVCPGANIPSTTALATLNRDNGRELGLQRGANVVMPNLTPPKYRALYEIYPAKACLYESADDCNGCLRARLTAIGRPVGRGAGVSPAFGQRGRAERPAGDARAARRALGRTIG